MPPVDVELYETQVGFLDRVIAEDGVMHSVPPRETLFRCQTPQCFRLSVISRAHELAAADPGFAPTDDCGVVLRYLPETKVHIVPGSERNIKVTYPHDLAVAEALLRSELNSAPPALPGCGRTPRSGRCPCWRPRAPRRTPR